MINNICLKKTHVFLLVMAIISIIPIGIMAKTYNQAKSSKKNAEKANKTLVLVYSRTGNTYKVAQEIAEKLGADLERVMDKKKRAGVIGYIIAGRDALKAKTTTIEPIKAQVSDYDRVLIGTPVWAGKITPAIRTVIQEIKPDLKQVAFFTTSGGEIKGAIFESLKNLTGKQPLATLSIIGKDLAAPDQYNAKIEVFLTELK